jgi:acyl-CoA synthetase (AMP-forming)/AMP-acid ligase II
MVFDVVQLGRVPERVRATVRKVSVGGAPTPMEAKRALADIFPGAEIIEAYGQTEATDGVTMARGTSVFDREGTVGRTNPHVLVDVRRPDGSLADAGEEGEIVIGGPTVMAGYHRDPAATAAAVRDGWLHTGDLGRRDEDGWFYVTGRLKDVVITGGENVSPAEVEDVLRTHPDVADVAVIGTPHPRWGEQVTAVVVRRPGAALDAATLGAFAATRLAGFKKPRRIEFVAALPRNAAGKVQTSALRERFAR